MEEYKLNVEAVLLGYYIKYDTLLAITNEAFANKNYPSESIDVYIDVHDMLLPLYRTNLYANKKFTIVSSVINLAAHIRNFYWSRYSLSTRIYLVYADGSTESHKQFYNKFGTNDFSQMLNYDNMNKIINDQLSMIKILCSYLYGVYYVKRSCDFSVFAYDNISKNLNIPSMLFTKSIYAYQVPALLNNTVIFRPKKFQGNDLSFSVYSENVLSKFCAKINNEETIKKLNVISPQLLSLLMALSGLASKRVNSLLNVSTSIARIYNAILNNKILNSYNSDMDYVYKQLNIDNKIDCVNFKYRFNAIDLLVQHRIYINSAESKDVTYYINLDDRQTLQNINDKYFVDNPLDLKSF